MTLRYLRFPGGKQKALTFSYDDAVEQDIRLVEIFRKHGLKATFNINGGKFSPEGTVHPEGKIHRRMTAKQVRETYTEDVCEVACHAYSHPVLTDYDPALVTYQVMQDRLVLEKLFDRQIHGMAYPHGRVNDMVVNVLKNTGIWYCRTIVSTEKFEMPTDWLLLPATCHHDNPRLMELADKFLAPPTKFRPQLFYVWGHAYEFEQKDNWHVIENFAEKMSGKDDIWYCTNMELYLAWKDYMNLETSADGSILYNPSVRPVWIADTKGNTYEIKPGETIRI